MELKYFNTTMAYYNYFDEATSSTGLLEDKKLLSTSKKSRYGSFTLPSDTSRTFETYICKHGDTLAGIALKFDTTIETLKKLNKFLYYAGNSLSEGDKLIISVKKVELDSVEEVSSSNLSQTTKLDQIEINLNENLDISRRGLDPLSNHASGQQNSDHPKKDAEFSNQPKNSQNASSSSTDNKSSKNSSGPDQSKKTKINPGTSTNLTDLLSSFGKNLSQVKNSQKKLEKTSYLKNEINDEFGNFDKFEIEEEF